MCEAETPGDRDTYRSWGRRDVRAGVFCIADRQPVVAIPAPGVLVAYPGGHVKFVVLVMLP